MPVRIAAELDYVERVNAGFQERRVVVIANAFNCINEVIAVTDLLTCLPYNVLQPLSAQVVATQFQVFVAHQVEEYQSAHPLQLIRRNELRDVATAAVEIVRQRGVRIGRIWVMTLFPIKAERFFPIKKHEPVGKLRLLL